ncbi:hypothetical protein BGX38DRAFT_1198061 [Terfezia claveryi]|nr:hypothetical protein BGX38DRAFT_1198061 [Terfezia claveryi]
MSLKPSIGSCPCCQQPFKSAGALSNHLENKHPNQERQRRKRRQQHSQSDVQRYCTLLVANETSTGSEEPLANEDPK